MNKFYLTTPLYYVNACPHIGHAYTNIISDCMARFKRLKKDNVFFLTGTDEHGEKIKKAAEKNKKDTKTFVDEMAGNFIELWKELNISYDFFIRTTQDFHIDVVKEVIKVLYNKGDIYKAKYKGFYCLPCETFWPESQIKELNICLDCKRPIEEIEEENYFFKLSKYQDWLKDFLKDNPNFIKPKSRYNEIIGFLENNQLLDLCISRPKKRISWGIDFPIDNNYVVYVWFDALLNYISGVGFYFEPERFNTLWPADIHFMAKDILKQHAIYWPIMLRALEIKPPKLIFAHGWWKIGEDKISKSKGNIVNPLEIISFFNSRGIKKEFSVDILRYFLLREVPLGLDGNFSLEALINRANSELSNDLGNLVFRTLNMVEKYFDGNISVSYRDFLPEFQDKILYLEKKYIEFMEEGEFSLVLENIFKLVNSMNKYIEEKKPWELFKNNKKEELKNFLYILLEGLRIISLYIYPFMPSTAIAINRQLGLEDIFDIEDRIWGKPEGFKIKKESPIFPRLDVN